MFGAPGLGFTEIVVLGILALLVVGPKDLPLMLRKLGRWTARLRGMAHEFRSGFDELARQAELDELRREVDALRRDAQAVHSTLTRPIDVLATPVPMTPIAPAATVDPDPGPPELPEPAPPPAPEIPSTPPATPEIPEVTPPPAPPVAPPAPIPTEAAR